MTLLLIFSNLKKGNEKAGKPEIIILERLQIMIKYGLVKRIITGRFSNHDDI